MRVLNLQALRGVACLLVLFFHVALWESATESVIHPILAPFLSFGFAGVDLFFVLSGFVITWVNAGALGDHSRLPIYLFRRLWRIYPLYWVCWWVALPAVLGLAADWTGYLRSERLARVLLLVPTTQTNWILPQAWTLSFEIVFYMAFAAFFLLPRRAFLPVLGLWFAATAAATAIPSTSPLWTYRVVQTVGWLVHPRILEFLFGCFAAAAVRQGWTCNGRTTLIAGVLGFAGGGLTYYLAPESAGGLMARVILFGAPSSLIVYGAVAFEQARGWVLPRWLQIVGDASYPIYLIHLATFAVTARLMDGLSNNLPMHLLRIGVMSVGGLAAGFFVHFAVERPLLNLVRRRRPAPSALALRRAA